MLWVWSTLLAGLFQAWRTALQHKLRALLSVSGAGFVRYGFGMLFAVPMATIWLVSQGDGLNGLSAPFLFAACAAGLAQLVATALLISSFDNRGFVAGTAFSKTEALQAAIGAALFAGERLSPLAWGGIAIGIGGVLLLALAGRGASAAELRAGLFQPAAIYGLSAATLFAITGLLVKKATGLLDGYSSISAALVTLVVVMAVQTVVHGCWIAIKEPATIVAIAKAWKPSAMVGLFSAVGSACWFAGFASAPVALVRIVGQVEVIFTLLFAHHLLHQKVRRHEVAALLMVASGVVLALIGGWSPAG